MSGTMIVQPSAEPDRHYCGPPDTRPPTIFDHDHYDFLSTISDNSGAVWRCDCGQYWHGHSAPFRSVYWVKIPALNAWWKSLRATVGKTSGTL